MTPAEALAAAASVEKLGIIGVLFLVCILLGAGLWYFRKQAVEAYAQGVKDVADIRALRELDMKQHAEVVNGLQEDIGTLKQMFLIVKLAADQAGAKYDLRGIGDLDALLKRG